MVKQVAWLSAIVLGMFVAACGSEGPDATARVTIDVRCGSNTDCPTGFSCEAEVEHGPPTTMCESNDANALCPAGYDTQVGYSQVFCKVPVRRAAASPKRPHSSRHGLDTTGTLASSL